jgi:hypothetical protein
MLAAVLRAGVDDGSDEDPRHRDDERHDEPKQHRRIRPVLEERPEPEQEREEKRKPAPLGRRGKAEADASDEEEQERDDSPHGGFIPSRGEVESRVLKRGSQDSNLGPAVLETAATTS